MCLVFVAYNGCNCPHFGFGVHPCIPVLLSGGKLKGARRLAFINVQCPTKNEWSGVARTAIPTCDFMARTGTN